MGRILSIDYGIKKSGLAISDETKQFARGLKVVFGIENLKKEMDVLIEYYCIDKILLGVSKKSDESLGDIGVLSVDFGDYLKEKFSNIELVLYDEAMTTRKVEEKLREMGRPLKKYKKEIDKYAAEIMLQEYLNN